MKRKSKHEVAKEVFMFHINLGMDESSQKSPLGGALALLDGQIIKKEDFFFGAALQKHLCGLC